MPCHFFNLRQDPGESRDLVKEHPEMTQRLRKLYADWSKEVAPKPLKKPK